MLSVTRVVVTVDVESMARLFTQAPADARSGETLYPIFRYLHRARFSALGTTVFERRRCLDFRRTHRDKCAAMSVFPLVCVNALNDACGVSIGVSGIMS